MPNRLTLASLLLVGLARLRAPLEAGAHHGLQPDAPRLVSVATGLVRGRAGRASRISHADFHRPFRRRPREARHPPPDHGGADARRLARRSGGALPPRAPGRRRGETTIFAGSRGKSWRVRVRGRRGAITARSRRRRGHALRSFRPGRSANDGFVSRRARPDLGLVLARALEAVRSLRGARRRGSMSSSSTPRAGKGPRPRPTRANRSSSDSGARLSPSSKTAPRCTRPSKSP